MSDYNECSVPTYSMFVKIFVEFTKYFNEDLGTDIF